VKRKMNKKYMAALSILMLGLMTAGVVYAHWTDKLFVSMTINTGKLHLEPRVEDMYWPHPQTGEPVVVWFNDHSTAVIDVEDTHELYKWNGWEKEWVIPYGDVTADIGANSFYIELLDVYPCLTAIFNVTLYNDGTIPAGFNGLNLLYLKENGDDVNPSDFIIVEDFSGWPEGTCTMYVYDPTSPFHPDYTVCEIEIEFIAQDGTPYPHEYAPPHSWEQIDPCMWVQARVKIHFNEALKQNTEYTFGFELVYVNWNEAGLV
jgi:hypothetical protein